MRIAEPAVPSPRGRATDLPRLGRVVVPRWVRERRRAERLAARPAVLADVIARRLTVLARPDREKTIHDLLAEQGVQPFDAERYRRESLLSSADWAELRAAIAAGPST